MTISPDFAPAISEAEPIVLSLDDVADRLAIDAVEVRRWLSLFNRERRYDASGHLWLSGRDVEFLRLVKSLRDVDRSCESIARLLGADPEVGPLRLRLDADDPAPEPADGVGGEAVDEAADEPGTSDIAQVETLKAELRDLHAKPTKKPFWKFW